MSARRRKKESAAGGPARSYGAPGLQPGGTSGSVAWRPSPWIVAAVLSLVTIAIYSQVSTHTFISLDDGDYVTANPHVMGGLTAENIRWALTTGYAANWHPLTWISLQADVSAFGVNAGPLHLANLAWHVLDTLLLFGLVRAMTGSLWRSAFVAALFGVHPAHVESVAWVAERKDVLSAAFWFGTTWAYVAWVRRPVAWRYGLMLVLFALGLMSKPMLVTLPATLLLLDLWPLERRSTWTRKLLEKTPLFAMAAASSIATVIAQHGAIASLELVPWPTRLANAVLSYGRYLVTLFWPANLSILYQLRAPVPSGPLALSIIAIVAISAIAWRARRTSPFLLVGWLWYLGTLVPVIGLVQVGMQSMADRYTYIPSVGIFMAVVWTAGMLTARARFPWWMAVSAGAGIVAVLSAVSYAQTATWATSETLWRRAATATSDNPRAHIELGVVYGHQSRHAEAEMEFKQALQMRIGDIDAKDLFRNLGGSLIAQNKFAEAVPQLEQAIALDGSSVGLRHELAMAYSRVGRPDDALAAWREALRIDPKFEEAYLGIAVLQGGRGQIAEARQALTELLRLNPNRKDAQQVLALLQGK